MTFKLHSDFIGAASKFLVNEGTIGRFKTLPFHHFHHNHFFSSARHSQQSLYGSVGGRCTSVCPSVCLSVRRQLFTKIATPPTVLYEIF